jgi:hypothetical protein
VAGLDTRTDSFINLLFEVSGRARPTDMQSLTLAEASEMLRAYQAAHPERDLVFEGEALVPRQSATPAPAASVSAASIASDDGMFEFGPPATSETAVPAGIAAPSGTAGGVDLSTLPSVGVADAGAASGDFVDLPPLEGAGDASTLSPRVPVYWWIIVVLTGWLGGLVGFFLLRGSNPKGARNVLIVGVAVTLLSIAMAVAAFFLGFGALLTTTSTLMPVTAP